MELLIFRTSLFFLFEISNWFPPQARLRGAAPFQKGHQPCLGSSSSRSGPPSLTATSRPRSSTCREDRFVDTVINTVINRTTRCVAFPVKILYLYQTQTKWWADRSRKTFHETYSVCNCVCSHCSGSKLFFYCRIPHMIFRKCGQFLWSKYFLFLFI